MDRSINFELPVMHYLTQWISIEKPIYIGLKSEDADQRLKFLRKATAFFRVARNLKKVHEEGQPRLKPLLEMWDEIEFKGDHAPFEAVSQLQRRVACVYETQALSLSTKMLWMKFRHPFIIYDSQACKAVRATPGNYEDFLSKWNSGFSQQEPVITQACDRIRNALTLPDAHEALGEKWFHQRVFDIYLWNKGKG